MPVSDKVVMETIQKMKDSGLEDDVILATLKDIGLTESQARTYLARTSGTSSSVSSVSSALEEESDLSEELEAPSLSVHEQIAERTASKVRDHLVAEKEEAALHQTVTHAALQSQSLKLDELHEKVSSLQSSDQFSSVNSQLSQISSNILELKKYLAETKALGSAQKDLLEKILEANRKLLNKLEK